MEREENFQSGDRNNSNGTSLEQREASADVFEDGQNRSVETAMRQMKDAEPFVYGDSREDNPQDGGFRGLEDEAMVETSREDLPEAHKPDAEFLEEHPGNQEDQIKPHYRVTDGGEEAVIVPKEVL